MRIDEWLEMSDRDRDEGARVLLVVRDNAVVRLRRMGCRTHEAEDLADSAVDLIVGDAPGRLRRVRNRGASLVSWLTGAALRIRRHEATRRVPAATLDVDQESASREDMPAPSDRSLPTEVLTPGQLRAVELARRGLSEREAAAAEGVSRESYRERLSRAVRRMRDAPRFAAPSPPRAWAESAAREYELTGIAGRARLLRLHAQGFTHREIGTTLGRSTAAVREIISRERARAASRSGGE